MNIQALVRYGRLYLRSETLVAEIRLRLLAKKAALLAFCVAVSLFGIGMLNIAAFQALELIWGPIWTALTIAGVDFVLAGLALFIALMLKPGHELALAQEVRQTALDAAEQEITAFRAAPLSHIGGLLSGTLEANAAHLLLASVKGIARSLRGKTN